MSSRQLVVLGTASQAPTRYRSHNSYALRWDDQLILFDPGEGTQRQCILAGVAIARATAVCITHFHGDHCLGLPGVMQRRALDNQSGTLPGLPVFFPADGRIYFDRMRAASIFHDTSRVEPRPIVESAMVAQLGSVHVEAIALDHRVTTFGYRLTEPDGMRLDPDALAHRGIQGPDIGRLQRDGSIETPNGTVGLDQVATPRRGQSMAFVMDTGVCDAVLELADGVDLLVCESTFLHAEADLAARFRHLTARQAAELATKARARRLVLTHFSARYPDDALFSVEASRYHHDVVAATDLAVIEVPGRSSD